MKSYLEHVQETLAEIARIPAAEVNPEARLLNDLGLDSLLVVEFGTLVGQRCGRAIPLDTCRKWDTVRDVIRHLETETAQAAGA